MAATYRFVRVDKAVYIQHGYNVPVRIVGYVSHGRIAWHEQLVDEVRNRGGGNPFACVDIGLDEDGFVASLVGDLDAAYDASLVGFANAEGGDNVRIAGLQEIQPLVYLVQRVVLRPLVAISTLLWTLCINQLLHVVDHNIVADVVIPQQLLEGLPTLWGQHNIRGLAQMTRLPPAAELQNGSDEEGSSWMIRYLPSAPARWH